MAIRRPDEQGHALDRMQLPVAHAALPLAGAPVLSALIHRQPQATAAGLQQALRHLLRTPGLHIAQLDAPERTQALLKKAHPLPRIAERRLRRRKDENLHARKPTRKAHSLQAQRQPGSGAA